MCTSSGSSFNGRFRGGGWGSPNNSILLFRLRTHNRMEGSEEVGVLQIIEYYFFDYELIIGVFDRVKKIVESYASVHVIYEHFTTHIVA